MNNKCTGEYIIASELARRMGISRQRVYTLIMEGIIYRGPDYLIHYPTAKKIIEDRRCLDKNYWKYQNL